MADDVYVLIEHLQGQVTEISYAMLAAGREVVKATGGKLVALLFGNTAEGLAKDLGADQVRYVDHASLADFTPEAYQKVLEAMIPAESPRLVLMGDTSIGSDIAGVLSTRLQLPLVSRCLKIEASGGALKFISQICGGKILAEGEIGEGTTLVTMVPGAFKAEEGQSSKAPEVVAVDAPDLTGLRVALKQYIEPEMGDVDVTKEPVLIAVGRGIQQEANLEEIEELAEVLGGAVCASRPVVDQGWLPTSRLIGKSGRSVSPKLYLALGISGAPEHTESITGSQMIIAVNTDPSAPIFEIAKYGANVDLLDLVPVLTEKARAAKGG
jgi:electron transfer flavoprotein alpha subunit